MLDFQKEPTLSHLWVSVESARPHLPLLTQTLGACPVFTSLESCPLPCWAVLGMAVSPRTGAMACSGDMSPVNTHYLSIPNPSFSRAPLAPSLILSPHQARPGLFPGLGQKPQFPTLFSSQPVLLGPLAWIPELLFWLLGVRTQSPLAPSRRKRQMGPQKSLPSSRILTHACDLHGAVHREGPHPDPGPGRGRGVPHPVFSCVGATCPLAVLCGD